VGDPISATEAENILRHNLQEVTIKKLQSLHSLPKEQNEFSEIILCAGRLSYKESIQLIVESKNNSYKWHGLHTNSIVGSTHKKFTGEVYSLER
jgi:hypothetical protein